MEKIIPSVELSKVKIQDILNDSTTPKFYATGTTLGYSVSDANIVFQRGQIPLLVISMPFPGLKTLHNAIGSIITQIEDGLGNPILDYNALASKWKENSSKQVL
jgi:hypothetical protein